MLLETAISARVMWRKAHSPPEKQHEHKQRSLQDGRTNRIDSDLRRLFGRRHNEKESPQMHRRLKA